MPALAIAGMRPSPGGARWLAFPAAAACAAGLAAAAVFLLRPHRAHALGWALTGAGIAYGVGIPLGAMLLVLYDPLGLRLLGIPRDTAVALVPRALFVLLLVGGGIGGYLGYRERTGSSVF